MSTLVELEEELTAIKEAKKNFISGGLVYKFHKGDTSMTFLTLKEFNEEIDRIQNAIAVMRNNIRVNSCVVEDEDV